MTPLRRSLAVFDAAASGALGPQACDALDGVLSGWQAKLAATPGVEYTPETEPDARRRRLAELLRRREPTGLATGSANPNPSKDPTP